LAECIHGGTPIWIENEGPERIALRGMLQGAGVARVEYGIVGQQGGVGLRADPLTVFKALQLAHSLEFGHEFKDFVAFDLETTDKDVAGCEIVEIGAVRVRDGKTADEFHALVRPRVPVSAQARAVHGYADEDLERAPHFEDIWPSFRNFIGRDLLVAHNAFNFDVPVLRRMAAEQEGVGELVFFDSLLLARSLYSAGARLEDLAHRFGVDAGRAHHALDDALTLARVFGALTRLKVIRARKSALVNLLDYLGLALALDDHTPLTSEAGVLAELTRTYALGRYSDCLEFYQVERMRLGAEELPTLAEVIDRLGGRKLMERLRADRTAQQRYPEAYARLRAVLDTCLADTVDRSIERVLEHIALSTSEGVEVDPHRVNLLTLHSTKGLEFSRVYIVGVEDFQIPARRLLYVGMTRAEDRLVLTRVDRRAGKDSGGSRFLEEMGMVAERV
jgi:DNA polymerase III epsilon subunit family exonuclease